MCAKSTESSPPDRPADWEVVFEKYRPHRERDRESQLALGNGHLLARAIAPEAVGDGGCGGSHYAGLYVAGGYDHGPREVRGERVTLAALVNLPNPFGLSFRPVGDGWCGDWYSMDAAMLVAHEATLDLRGGVLRRHLVLRDAAGRRTELHETRLVSVTHEHLALLRWHLRPIDWSGEIEIRAAIDCGVANRLVELDRPYESRPRLVDVSKRTPDAGRAVASARFVDPPRRVAVATRLAIAGADARPVPIDPERHEHASLVTAYRAHLSQAGVQVCKWIAVALSPDDGRAVDRGAVEAQALAGLERAPDAEALISDQQRAWSERWDHIALEAAPARVARALRFNAFHLMQTLCRADSGTAAECGLPARGWQEMYGGQVFWDELLAVPFLATHFPQIARRLVAYRHRHLDEACRRARRAGLRGAWFPWRDADRGCEETPRWQLNPLSGRWIHDHTEHQLHLHGAIAYCIWQTWLATGDDEFLGGHGGALLVELARFWRDRAHWNPDRGRYELRGVVGPDEFHPAYPGSASPGIDNNAYTNVLAAWSLRRAAELPDVLPAAAWAALSRARGLDADEPSRWKAMADRFFVPFLADGVLAQFDGFERLRPFPSALIEGHPDTRADWLLEAHGESVQAYQVIKQPDVVMLPYLFPGDELAAELRALGYHADTHGLRTTVDHYLARTTHDSGLSAAICAGALASIDPSASWRFYERALAADLRADAHTREGLHLGSMAGTLDVLQRHYLGVRPVRDGLRIDPRVPRELERTALVLQFRGATLQVRLQDDEVVVRADRDGLAEPVLHLPDGTRAVLSAGRSIAVPARPDRRENTHP